VVFKDSGQVEQARV